MTIDEAILKYKNKAQDDCTDFYDSEEYEQLAEWLEKLKYIENIILKWNADYFNDEDTGIPDDEILEAIFNACTNNGFDIPIDEDYKKVFESGYDKAIEDFVVKYKFCNDRSIQCHKTLNCADCIAEQLKEGGVDERAGNN